MQHKRSLTRTGRTREGKRFVGVWIPARLKTQIDIAAAKRDLPIQELVEIAVRREIGAERG